MPPLGWYYAQGLVPLGYDSSDDDEGPATLPNGKVVCGPHGFVVCGKCCVDFSFVETDSDYEDDDEDDEGQVNNDDVDDILAPGEDAGPVIVQGGRDFNKLRKGTGVVFATKFVPPSATITPDELFSGRKKHIMINRIVHRSDPSKVLIRTDGACLDNGQANPRAGWGFWHGYQIDGSWNGRQTPGSQTSVAWGRLECQGPFGDEALQTSNRAELRAVIAALRFRHWPGEGFRTMVIATDSDYVVEGATTWTKTWIKKGWKTSMGLGVKNRDLWEALLGEFERWKIEGMAVQFWKIPREWNTVADENARKGAEQEAIGKWAEIMGMAF